MARPTFSELMDLDVPLAAAVMESLPRQDDGTAMIGKVLRGIFLGK